MRDAPDTRQVSDGNTALKFSRRVGVVVERRTQELGGEIQTVGKARFERRPVDHRISANAAIAPFSVDGRRDAACLRCNRRQALDAAQAQPAQQDRVEFAGIHRFRNVIVHPRRQITLAVGGKRVRRHRQDRHRSVLRQLAYPARRFKPVKTRHLDIHQDQLVSPLRGHLQRLDAIGRGVDRQSGRAQQILCHFLIDRIVFDEEQRRLAVFGERRFVIGHA